MHTSLHGDQSDARSTIDVYMADILYTCNWSMLMDDYANRLVRICLNHVLKYGTSDEPLVIRN